MLVKGVPVRSIVLHFKIMMSTITQSRSLQWLKSFQILTLHIHNLINNYPCHISLSAFSLQILQLLQNEIVDIQDLAFNDMNRLKILDTSQNKLINTPTLSYVKNTLEELNLSWNIFSDNYSAQSNTDTIIISLNFNCLHVFLTDIAVVPEWDCWYTW